MKNTKLIGVISAIAILATCLAGCGSEGNSVEKTAETGQDAVVTEQTATPEIDDEDVDVVEQLDSDEIVTPEDNIAPEENSDDPDSEEEDDIIDEEVLKDQKKIEQETGIAPEDQGKNNGSASGSRNKTSSTGNSSSRTTSSGPSSGSSKTDNNSSRKTNTDSKTSTNDSRGSSSKSDDTSVDSDVIDYTPAIPEWANSYSSTPSSVTVKWGKVPNASGYKLYFYGSDGEWTPIGTTEKTSFTYDKSLKSGTIYSFKVRSYRDVDDNTFWSKTSDTKYAMTAPAKTTLTLKDVTTSSVTCEWNSVACDGYDLQIEKNGEWKDVVNLYNNTVSCKVNNLASDTTYKFRVRAYRTDTKNNVVRNTYSDANSIRTKVIVTTTTTQATTTKSEPTTTTSKTTTTVTTTKAPVTTTTPKATTTAKVTTTTSKPTTTTSKTTTTTTAKPKETTTTTTTTAPKTTTTTTTTTTVKVEPKIIGYKYKMIHHDEVTKDAVMNVKMQLDGIKLACDSKNTLPSSSHYNGNDEFLSIVQLQYNDWDTFRSKVVLSQPSAENATATDLKNAYLNGEIEFYCDFPGLNTSKSALDWYVDRFISAYCKEHPNSKLTSAGLESEIKNNWKKNGYSSWQEYAFDEWFANVATHWITDNFYAGVWHKPYKKLVTFEYATIQRIGVIYDNNTTASITPVDTDYASEKAFLKKQGLTLNESDPEWVKYNSYEFHKPTSIDDLPY